MYYFRKHKMRVDAKNLGELYKIDIILSTKKTIKKIIRYNFNF